MTLRVQQKASRGMDFLKEWVGSGLFNGGRVVLRSATFRRDPGYRDGQEPALFVDFFQVDEQETLEQQRIGIGNGWEEQQEGTRIERADGGKPIINDNTAAGKFITSLLGDADAVKAIEARWAAGDKVTPQDAAFWDGLDVELEQKSRDFKTRDGEDATQRWYDVTKFHGYEGSGAASGNGAAAPPAKKAAAKKSPPAKKAAGAKPPTAAEAPVEAAFTPDQAVLDAIRAQADVSNDFEEFVVNCYTNVAEVGEREEYQALVDDTENVEGSIWRQAVEAYEAAQG